MNQQQSRRGRQIIVVPRPLAEHFHERLQQRYEDRPDVVVVVDRRRAERRRATRGGPVECGERRRSDRRANTAAWSLPELPMRMAGDPLAGGRPA